MCLRLCIGLLSVLCVNRVILVVCCICRWCSRFSLSVLSWCLVN